MATGKADTQPRTETVTVRVTREENRKIRKLAKAKDMSVSELLHEKIVDPVVAEHDRLHEFLRTAETG